MRSSSIRAEPAVVAARAAAAGVPCAIIAGSIDPDADRRATSDYTVTISLERGGVTRDEAVTRAAELLEQRAAELIQSRAWMTAS